MAIAEPAHLNRKLDGTLMCFVENVRVQGILWMNYLLIGLFLIQIWEMTQQLDMADCSGRLLLLEFGCVFLFEVRMLDEVRKALAIMWLLWAAPKERESHYANDLDCSPSAGAIFEKEVAPEPLGGLFMRTLKKKFRRDCAPSAGATFEKDGAPEPESGLFIRTLKKKLRRMGSSSSDQWKLDGISRCYRLFCMLNVAIPVLLLSLATAYLGGLYILRSGSEEKMVMNTLALEFVANIEQFLYMAFTSDAVRYSVETMKPVEVDLTNRQRVFGWFSSSILCPMVIIATAGYMMYHTRGIDCPYFEWTTADVIDALRVDKHMGTDE